MKVALVSQEYPPETAHGGIASQTRLKAQGLAERGHDVYVVSHSVDDRRHERTDGRVHVIRIPGPDAARAIRSEAERWMAYSGLVAEEVAALHDRVRLELIDFPEWGGEGYIYLRNGRKVPTVVHIQGPLVLFVDEFGWPERGSELHRIGMEMEGTSLRLADVVISASRLAADRCAEAYRLRRDDIDVLHLGVDTAVFRPLGVPSAPPPTIVFLGRLAPNKGVEPLLEAWFRLRRDVPGLRLRMIGRGDGPFADGLRAAASVAGAEQDLDLAGFVARDFLPEELARADVVALPSFFEGGPGLAALEAMACGRAVVACEGTGTAEVIEDGRTGLLVPPRDVDALTAVLGGLLADPQKRAAIGVRAREAAVRKLDFRDRVEVLERLYEEAIRRTGAVSASGGGRRAGG